LDGFYQLVAYFISAHLRLQVIGSYLRRFYQDPVFSFVGLFYTAVKEEGYVSIFLCLCNTGLLQSVSCKEFSKGILDRYLMKGHFCIRDRRIILCKAYIGKIQSLFSFKAVKFICTESSCDFSGSVWTEIKENNRVFILDRSHWLSVLY